MLDQRDRAKVLSYFVYSKKLVLFSYAEGDFLTSREILENIASERFVNSSSVSVEQLTAVQLNYVKKAILILPLFPN